MIPAITLRFVSGFPVRNRDIADRSFDNRFDNRSIHSVKSVIFSSTKKFSMNSVTNSSNTAKFWVLIVSSFVAARTTIIIFEILSLRVFESVSHAPSVSFKLARPKSMELRLV